MIMLVLLLLEAAAAITDYINLNYLCEILDTLIY